MERNGKIAIGCGIGCFGALALFACTGAGAMMWINNRGPAIAQSLMEMDAEGEAFGKANDAEGCVVEGLRRNAGTLDDTMFLFGCLEVAKKPDGFCDDVPKLASTMKEAETVAGWRVERCEALGHPGERCQQLLVQQQTACER